MNCPKCGNGIIISNIGVWQQFSSVPIECDKCGIIWIEQITQTIKTFKKPEDQIPPIIEYTKVYITNREHPKYLEPGVIAARAHVRYRIRFNDGYMLWMPEHWVKAI